jgi:type 1 glutamine amidotransferase
MLSKPLQPTSIMRIIIALMIMLMTGISGYTQPVKKRVLIFFKTTRYYHESIPAGIAAIQKLGRAHGFIADTTTDSTLFVPVKLKRYAAIIFLSTSGNNLLDTVQKQNFTNYVKAGGGFMGIHSASASEKGWPWYGRLVGAVFTDHPEPQPGKVIVTNRSNAATAHLPAIWYWKDEWYNFKEIPTGVHVLFCADEQSYQGGKNGKYHPLAWYHNYDGGRAFYTALGHFSEAYTNPLFLKHLLAGLQYAMGISASSTIKQ